MSNLKTMRDKLNGSIPMGVDENEELMKMRSCFKSSGIKHMLS